MNIEIESKKFDLSPDIISTMVSLMDQTSKDGKEHGFLMCRTDGGQITAGKTCAGNQCSIALTDCGDKHEVGSFHTHPTVISFSLSDYLSSAVKAKSNPKKDYLLCVSLVDKGVRCKALTKVPSDELLASIPHFDTDETRAMIKPFFTKRVNIGLNQMASLLAGVAWDKLPESEDIIAVDEGEDSCAPSGSKCLEPAGMFAQAPKGSMTPEEKADFDAAIAQFLLMGGQGKTQLTAPEWSKINSISEMCEAIVKHISKSGQDVMTPDILPLPLSHFLTKYCAKKGSLKDIIAGITEKVTGQGAEMKSKSGVWWPTKPTGQYPWSQKKQYKSVKTPDGGVGLEPIPAAKIKSPETEFIDITSIEEPDPTLIAQGEVMGYVNALTPLQLLDQKDEKGKWIIHDGRHRLVAWKVGGYKQMPVVFVDRPEEEK